MRLNANVSWRKQFYTYWCESSLVVDAGSNASCEKVEEKRELSFVQVDNRTSKYSIHDTNTES